MIYELKTVINSFFPHQMLLNNIQKRTERAPRNIKKEC